MKRLAILSLALAILLIPYGLAQAPSTPLPLYGTVYDYQGTIFIGANVSVTNMDTGEMITPPIRDDGNYNTSLEGFAAQGDLLLVEARATGWYGANTTIVQYGKPLQCNINMLPRTTSTINLSEVQEILFIPGEPLTTNISFNTSHKAYWTFEMQIKGIETNMTTDGEIIRPALPKLLDPGKNMIVLEINMSEEQAENLETKTIQGTLYINQTNGEGQGETAIRITVGEDMTVERSEYYFFLLVVTIAFFACIIILVFLNNMRWRR